jgi:hypothetical protein
MRLTKIAMKVKRLEGLIVPKSSVESKKSRERSYLVLAKPL